MADLSANPSAKMAQDEFTSPLRAIFKRNLLQEATNSLRTVSEQAQAIMAGSPESQGEMMQLIMGTLDELRDKVLKLESSAASIRN